MLKSGLYKPIFLTLTLLFSGLTALAQTVEVTFQVDMSNETVSANGVHIAGSFQSAAGLGDNWNPGATQVSDPDGDDIFSITVSLPAGTYEYKFINGNAWGSDERPPSDCSVGSTNNRQVSIGQADVVLPPVPFDGCLGNVTFSVNMQGETISPDGIHVMGNFQEAAGFGQNWDPTSMPMEDVNGDGSYEISVIIPPGEYEYLFVNGNEASGAEILPTDCSVAGTNGSNNRPLTVSPGQPDPATFCFSTCEDCDPYLSTDFDTHWWNDAVFYEIFVRSFYDSDGDGIGDFRGLIEKLDYLNDGDPETDTDLGITGIWLMPMMESPSYHGYDVTDYYKVEPDYGTMADFEAFLEEAHKRGIKVIIDLVLNHSSSQHPWFTQSASNSADYRDWYIWSQTNPGFQGPWGQTVWHRRGNDYFYGLFWGGMPDLNYTHPPVKEEMFRVADFWLDKGVDGYRLDAIKYMIEDGTVLENTQETFSLLEEFDSVYVANNPDVFTVGEVWSNTASIIPYVQNDRLDICFEFDLAGAIIGGVNSGNPEGIASKIRNVQESYPTSQYGTFLTNHDIDRIYSVIGSNTDKMKVAASIYLTLPGVPFIYYGEEVNMTGTGDHENIRRPMQWSNGANAGFSTASPWNDPGSNYRSSNVALMESNPNSLLNHYKRLIHIRNDQPALRRGNHLEMSNSDNQVLAYARIHDSTGVVVVTNLGAQTTNPSLSLSASTLPAGEYYVTDVYNEEALGTITINEQGGFESWSSPSGSLEARGTRILVISSELPTDPGGSTGAVDGLHVFPNPSTQTLNIQRDSDTEETGIVTIISSNGALVYEADMESELLVVETGDWAQGIYVVRLEMNGETETKKVVVQ